MAVGSCSECGYAPVAFGARVCPKCGADNPNPGVFQRFVGLGMLWGLAAGALVGGILGYGHLTSTPGWSGALGGALAGALPGLCAGLVLAVVAAVFARLAGHR